MSNSEFTEEEYLRKHGTALEEFMAEAATSSVGEREFLMGLDKEKIAGLLRDSSLIDDLAQMLHDGVRALKENAAKPSGTDKFVVGDLHFADRAMFFEGLESVVGTPGEEVEKQMRSEHCESEGCDELFDSGNYGVKTSPHIEWKFVVEPEKGPPLPEGRWPEETRGARTKRTPRSLSEFIDPEDSWLRNINKKLDAAGEALVLREELIGARLYTGPMYQKYNGLLREGGKRCPRRSPEDNLYTATIHAINSAVRKISMVTHVPGGVVYRGLKDLTLPPCFMNADRTTGARGGVELGFMSATTDHKVACKYAGVDNDACSSLVLAIQLSSIDRGADLEAISMYPEEQEVLIAPLAWLELSGGGQGGALGGALSGALSVAGAYTFCTLRLSVNLLSPSLERVRDRRRDMLVEFTSRMRTELRLQMRSRERQVTAWKKLDALDSIGADALVACKFGRNAAADRLDHLLDGLEAEHDQDALHALGSFLGAVGTAAECFDAVDGWPKAIQWLLDASPYAPSIDAAGGGAGGAAGDAERLSAALCALREAPKIEGRMAGALTANGRSGADAVLLVLATLLRAAHSAGTPAVAKVVDLSKWRVSDVGVRELLDAVGDDALPQLQKLTLDGNPAVGARAMERLQAHAHKLADLQTLSACDASLGDEGVRSLVGALPKLVALEELMLNNAEVTDAAADELGTSLANGAMARCTRLNLNFNCLSDGACTRLARTLAAAPAAHSLTKLQLNGNGHTDVTLGTLAELLHEGKLPKLAHLDVLGNVPGVFGEDAKQQLKSECEARNIKLT